MVGAALLVTSFSHLRGVDRGFEDATVILATVAPSIDRYDTPESVDAFYRILLDRVRAMPGVLAASTTYSPPLAGNDFWTTVVPEGVDPESPDADEAGMVIVRDGYFEANGIPLLRGRDFGPQDRLGEPLVAVVNETMAEGLWPGEDPLGKRFLRTRGVRGSAESFDETFFPGGFYTVVGVAGDVRRIDMAQDPGPEYYRPHRQIAWAFQYLVVRADQDADLVASQLRQAVWDLDPTVPVQTVEPLSARVERALAPERFRALLLTGFAAMTAFLAMVGLYALMALLVARRSREMGIRMALGAPGRTILRQILARGLVLVGIGLLLGLALALASGRLLSGMLFQVRPSDPVTYVTVAGITGLVALAACLLPARRASKLDPAATLRSE
jgi:predicted permease